MSQTVKNSIIEMIRRMPDDASVADIMEELYVRTKIDAGLAQLDAEESIPHDEVKERFARWLS